MAMAAFWGPCQHDKMPAAAASGLPAVGTRLRVLLPPQNDRYWLCTLYARQECGEHIILLDNNIFRKHQLRAGTWAVAGGLDSSTWPSGPVVEAGLQLLNKTLRVWFDGLHEQPRMATVVAYVARADLHTLRLAENDYRRCDLKQVHCEPVGSWQLPQRYAAAAAAAAAPGTCHTTISTAAGALGCLHQAVLEPATASSAAGPLAGSDAAAVVTKARAARPQHGCMAADHVDSRPPQHIRPCSRCLCGEHGLEAAAAAAHDIRTLSAAGKEACGTTGAWNAAPATTGQLAGSAGPSVEQLLAVVNALQVPHLAAGVGVLCSSVPAAVFKAVQVDLDSFALGNPLDAHASLEVAAGRPRLYREVVQDSSHVDWQLLSQPCHDCQQEHVPRACLQPGCDVRSSVCNRCLLHCYRTVWTLPELLERCPHCRCACVCQACLRNADPHQLAPVLQYSHDQQQRQARYVLHHALPHLKALLQQQQAEAAGWGFRSLADVPASPLDDLVRPLCDRCATQISSIAASCPDCGWELCCECAAELRQQAEAAAATLWCASPPAQQQEQEQEQQQQHKRPRLTAPAANQEYQGEARCGATRVPVTCCNPDCGKEASSQEGSATDLDTHVLLLPAGTRQLQAREQDVRVLGVDTTDDADGQCCSGELDEGDGSQQEVPSIVRASLCSRPDTSRLQLQLVLPPDLYDSLPELLRLGEEGVDTRLAPLQLTDCPLLEPGDRHILHTSPPAAPGSSSLLTLQDLQSSTWWRCMPAEQQDLWRRSAHVPGWPGSQSTTMPTAAAHAEVRCDSATAPHSSSATSAAAGVHAGSSASPAAASPADASTGSSVCLFTPHISDLQRPGPVGLLARLLFWARWQLGEPVIVRGVKGTLPWDPHTLERAMGSSAEQEELVVVDCGDSSDVSISHHAFFDGYVNGCFVRCHADGDAVLKAAMYKLKDWPASADIREKLCRHYADFLAMLPVRPYTEPRLSAGPLNMATALIERDNPTDLGPKCYIAYGRVAETWSEGDSVTKCHCDMTDAVNLLLDTAPGGDPQAQELAAHQQQQHGKKQEASAAPHDQQLQAVRCGTQPAQPPGYQGAGAVWDIWSRAALKPLNCYLAANAGQFKHRGRPVSAADDPLVVHSPVLAQAFMLTQPHRIAFLEFAQQQQQQQQRQQGQGTPASGMHGVVLWHFEQFEGEAVLIPGGCAHQVRNLKSCCKVAADFVSPESMGEALAHKARLRCADLQVLQPRDEAAHERQSQEKLQSQLILLRGVLRAARVLQAHAAVS